MLTLVIRRRIVKCRVSSLAQFDDGLLKLYESGGGDSSGDTQQRQEHC
jgi:hypothetical protein